MSQIGVASLNSPKDLRFRLWEVTVASLIFLATIVAIVMASGANTLAIEANRIANDALELAKIDKSVAKSVFLTEAPAWFETLDSESRQIVFNNSRSPISDVWVEGQIDTKPAKIFMWAIPYWEIYTLPRNFQPLRLHFYDGEVYWVKVPSGHLSATEYQPIPAGAKDDGDSPRAEATNCR